MHHRTGSNLKAVCIFFGFYADVNFFTSLLFQLQFNQNRNTVI